MKFRNLRRALVVTVTLLAFASSLGAQEPATEDDKILYALGLAVARNLSQFNLSAEELATVQEGLSDAVLGNDPKVDLNTYGPKIQEYANSRMAKLAEAEKVEAAKFLEQETAKPGADVRDSGLIITEITAGSGESPGPTDMVTVHYHGTLRDGTVFDSSVDRDETASFKLNQVIKCWTEGVQLMKVGGKSRLICPADIAYGDQGRPGIPPGAALAFDIELIAVNNNS